MRQTGRPRSVLGLPWNTMWTLTLLTALAACTSAAEHFEAGAGLEARGDIVRAAELRVSRSVKNLFAPGPMASFRQDLEDKLVEEAARRFGQRAFQKVLARAP